MSDASDLAIPDSHAAAVAWCRRLHPGLPIPEADCTGPLDDLGAVTPPMVGLDDYGCEVRVLVCRDCAAELAIGRGTDEMAAGLAPGLHGRLLWIDGADGRFAYLDRGYLPR